MKIHRELQLVTPGLNYSLKISPSFLNDSAKNPPTGDRVNYTPR
jgi:hypothetical protein